MEAELDFSDQDGYYGFLHGVKKHTNISVFAAST